MSTDIVKRREVLTLIRNINGHQLIIRVERVRLGKALTRLLELAPKEHARLKRKLLHEVAFDLSPRVYKKLEKLAAGDDGKFQKQTADELARDVVERFIISEHSKDRP